MLCVAAFLIAQTIGPDEIKVRSQPYVARPAALRAETNLVEIGVVVRDGAGHAVSGLTKANFQIHDNGKEREIADFSIDSVSGGPAAVPRPRFIALYFDDVNAQDQQHSNDLKQTREAALKLVHQALQPGVKIGVFTASGTPALEFTADQSKLTSSIESITPHVLLPENGTLVCSTVTPYLAYLVVVRHDPQAASQIGPRCAEQAVEIWRKAKEISAATLESIGRVADHLASMPGSRVLLVASSGFLTATLESQSDQVIDRALHGGVAINAIDSKGLDGWSPIQPTIALTGSGVPAALARQRAAVVRVGERVEAMNEPLAALAEGTGGIFFHDNNDLDAGFQQLAAPPELTYRLSFRLPEDAAEDSYHKLAVKVVNAKYKSVGARPGYFVPRKQTDSAPSKFDTEAVSADTLEDFPVQLSAANSGSGSGEINVSVVANVDISKLDFKKQNDRWTQKIRLLSALLDAEGAIVAAKEASMELALKEETYHRILKSGLNAKLTLQVRPGVYKLREVVEESGGKMACSTNPIEVK
jgi:VWFA-related protein